MNNPSPVRVLVFGFINMNVIDGSAFFLSSLASMLSVDQDVKVDILLANPVKRTLVYSDLFEKNNVRIIDPFSSSNEDFQRITSDGSLDHQSASQLIYAACKSTNYDLVIVRSTEVASYLVAEHRSLAAKCMLYVTGVVSASQGVPEDLAESLSRCTAAGMALLCQTPEMLREVSSVVSSEAQLITLQPMIPDVELDQIAPRRTDGIPRRFIYTGKFVADWNPLEILSGFGEVRYDNPDVRLTVAGDQFRQDNHDVLFVNKVKHLLAHSPGVEWVGGVDRSRARELILESDIGISWRNSRLDDSLELSTKLLEYGSLGRPCIMNRTPMHERIFGDKYPFYANTMREYVRCLELAVSDSEAYERASHKVLSVSRRYTYSAAFEHFLPHLVAHVSRVRGVSSAGVEPAEIVSVAEGAASVRSLDGVTYVDLRKVGLRYLLDSAGSSLRVGRLKTSIGPIAAFETVVHDHQSESDFDAVVVSRIATSTSATDIPGLVTHRSSANAEIELLSRSLQRAVSDLHKAKRKVVVDVGAAHREFRASRLEIDKLHQIELDKLRVQHANELTNIDALQKREVTSLVGELGKMRASKASFMRRQYWKLAKRLRSIL